MQADHAIESFQTMAIVSLNLIVEVNSLKNIFIIKDKEKVVLQEELDKERDFHKGYKHNVEIQRKNREKTKQNIKLIIKKLHDENEELKRSTT